jgi:FtsP/CotA-like multicopper oxidase with cupredoxin domain
MAGLGYWPALAQEGRPALKTLSGTDLDLRIGESPMNVTGTPKMAFTVNGSVPGPTLRW